MHCILFISNRERTSPGLLLISDDKSRIEKFQRQLQDLALRMSQCLTLGVAIRTAKMEMEQLIDRLDPLSMASVAPVLRTSCFPGTRTKVIEEITEWGLHSSTNVLWMYAHAGSGKSTISTTMAEVFERMGRLGSFVFFNRDVKERSEPSRMIRTIAYHLARHRKDIAVAIRSSMEQHSHIIDSGLDLQFQRLLVEPLIKLQLRDHLLVTSTSNYVRFMITSRRNPRIERVFANMDGLHIIDLDRVSETNDDIRKYILARMVEIQSEHHLPQGWPGISPVDALVQQANGLFIWATVACSYIQSYKPEIRIKTILSNPSVRARAEQTLNDLYKLAFRDADAGSGAWDDDDFATDMHNVLAIIIVSQNPQSLQSIGDILGIDRPTALVDRLRSILKKDEEGLVHVIHPSVRDYLVDSNRCDPVLPWFIREHEEHELMAMRCMWHLNSSLSRKMAKGPATPTAEQIFYETLPDSVTYASVSWVYHICRVNPSTELANEVRKFLSEHFLHWLEALSMLGRSRNAIDWLDQLKEWYSKFNSFPTYDPSFSGMLYDGWRFVKAFSKTIENDPSLVYETALQFCPKNTTISVMFNQDQAVSVVGGSLQHWSPSLMTLTECSMQVATLTISKSGDAIVAGCVDGTVNVWNATLGTEIFAIEEDPPNALRTRGLIHAQLMADGKRLLCGLLLGELCILDLDTGGIGTAMDIRDVGDDMKIRMNCASLAPDDRTVVCGFEDGKMQLWDTELQVQLTPLLVGHEEAINTIVFSHDQQIFISGSDDKTIRLWSRMGEHRGTFPGHNGAIWCVAFSQDDFWIASASLDETMKIWDTSTGAVLLTCRHRPEEAVYAVAFSNKGDRVATATYHWNIRIWDSVTGEEVMPPLSLHQGPVRALVFAPDDKTLISGGQDSHVRVWSIVNAHPHGESVEPAQTNEVNCVALSHDKTRFVSGSADTSIIVWNTFDGCASFPPLRGHEAEVVSVDFSKDDRMLASASKDGQIYLWDTATGQSLGPPLPFTGEIWTVKFSADGSRLAVTTKPHAITVWSIHDRSILFGPLPHPNCYWPAIALSNQGAKLATLYNYSESTGESNLGFGITIRDATLQGDVIFESKIDSEVEGWEMYGVQMEYTADDRYLVVWYSLSPDVVITRAFDTITGEECAYSPETPGIPQFDKLAAVIDATQIVRHGVKLAELPLDLDYMGHITCWDSTDDMIVIGTRSGASYCMKFHNK
ncbi:hypothetical protein FB451DRAFT_1430700 [Mycena latifolia]|nr:hypothetical protein FB451DRAFT_1430700 [Mycena latifolia]